MANATLNDLIWGPKIIPMPLVHTAITLPEHEARVNLSIWLDKIMNTRNSYYRRRSQKELERLYGKRI